MQRENERASASEVNYKSTEINSQQDLQNRASAGYQRSEAIVNSFGEDTREWCIGKKVGKRICGDRVKIGLGAKRAKSPVGVSQTGILDGSFRIRMRTLAGFQCNAPRITC
jgi:hypothetical protein